MPKTPPLRSTRRTKAERTKALAKVFKEAGFTREGADWSLHRNDLCWTAFLDVDRRYSPKAPTFDVVFSIDYLPNGGAEHDPWLLNHQGVGSSRSARSDPKLFYGYHEFDHEAEDPLIRDTIAILLPLVERVQTATDVVAALIDGTLGAREFRWSVHLADAYRIAGMLEDLVHVAQIQEVVNEGEWSYFDCQVLEDAGLVVPPESRIPERFFERLRRRIRDHQMRPRGDRFSSR